MKSYNQMDCHLKVQTTCRILHLITSKGVQITSHLQTSNSSTGTAAQLVLLIYNILLYFYSIAISTSPPISSICDLGQVNQPL